MKRNNIEDLFLSEELSLELRKLGFNEDCLSRFDGGGFHMLPAYDPLKNEEIKEPWFCTSPTYQQVFDWFEEKFKIHTLIETVLLDYGIIIEDKNKGISIIKTISEDYSYKNKLEVREACVKEVINIIKNIQNETNIATRN